MKNYLKIYTIFQWRPIVKFYFKRYISHYMATVDKL